MNTMLENDQMTLWDIARKYCQNGNNGEAKVLLKTTIEKSFKLIGLPEEIISDHNLEILPNDEILNEIIITYTNILKSPSYKKILDYIELICTLMDQSSETFKSIIASLLENLDDKFRKDEPIESYSSMYYTTSEVAKKLGLSDQTVRRMCESGRLKGAYRVNEKGHWRIPEDSFITTRNQDERATIILENIDKKNKEAGEIDEFNL